MTLKQSVCKKTALFVILTLILLLIYTPSRIKAETRTGYINGIDVNVRSGAATSYAHIDKLSNIYVQIIDEVEGQNATGWGNVWYKIKHGNIEGYVYGEYITVIESPAPDDNADFEKQLSAFPESYQDALRTLKAAHPNWTFKADELSLSFWDAVNGEDVFPRKLVPTGYKSSFKSMGKDAYDWVENVWKKDAGNWNGASTEVIAYYMDPRNFLNANGIYMFAQQSYDPTTQSQAGLEKLVEGTFLSRGYTDENDTAYEGSYINVIMEAARQSGISPYVIASLIIIEQGSSGNSQLISGTYPLYENYYNFFNYGAYGSTNTVVIEGGLAKAKELGWNTRSKSIIEGAKLSSTNYISAGQDTYYYMDFDVKAKPYFTHQYAQAIMDALNKGSKMRSYYSENPNAALSFTIPVYKDMPQSAVQAVESSDKLNNYYFTSLSIDGFSMYTENYTLSVGGDTTITYDVPSKAEYAGAATFPLKAGSNTVVLPVKAETGYTNDYTLTISADKDCTLTIALTDSSPPPIENPDEPDNPDNSQPQPSQNKRGDINGDGVLDVIDSTALRLHFLKIRILTGDKLQKADINQDGELDVIDSTALRLHFLKIKPIED